MSYHPFGGICYEPLLLSRWNVYSNDIKMLYKFTNTGLIAVIYLTEPSSYGEYIKTELTRQVAKKENA